MGRWGAEFDPDELARLEVRMWKAYYRHQPARLLGNLILGLRAQAGASWPRAIGASLLLTRAAAGFARADADYERFAPDIVRAYRWLGLPGTSMPTKSPGANSAGGSCDASSASGRVPRLAT
jgi:hypothetical protein